MDTNYYLNKFLIRLIAIYYIMIDILSEWAIINGIIDLNQYLFRIIIVSLHSEEVLICWVITTIKV